MKLNKHKLIYIWPQLKYLKIQLKIPQSDYINLKNYGEKNTHIRFHRAHAPGLKLTSGLCLYIGQVSGAGYKHSSSDAVVVLWDVFHIHTFIYLWRPTRISQLFQKSTYMRSTVCLCCCRWNRLY